MTETVQAVVADPIRAGVASGWDVVDASTLARDLVVEADVVIVGTGAGGGTVAEALALAGHRVALIEEGPLRSSSDFRMRESEAYVDLYQESAARKTRDKAINILQGRCVGGGTTVNWTSSFRTPPATLEYWAREFGWQGFGVAAMAPWFAKMEARLGIGPWTVAPNPNNAALARGGTAMGIATAEIQRNVRGCWNLGYCGMGCPVNAKQSSLITTVPAALDRGAKLVTRVRAQQLIHGRGRVSTLECAALDASGTTPTTRRVSVRARTFVVAGGAINSPALLLRSAVPDPQGIVGKRTFLHPTVVSAAIMPERIDGYFGAPQTVYTDHYVAASAPGGVMGFKLEAPPIHPILAGITLPGHGDAHAQWMRRLPNLHVQIALLRDGFHPNSPGGTVQLASDGTPVLDYPLTPYVWEGARRAFRAMAELQFAAGAREVMPIHGGGAAFTDPATARAAIDAFVLAPLATPVVSAHVMGGCPLGPDPARSAVDPTGRYHHLENLYVMDGSLFPTSIGTNPQLSIYGLVSRLADGLAQAMKT